MNLHVQKVSDLEDDDNKISELIPAQKPLPETIIVNITPNTAWSLGTEIDLPTLKEDDLALDLEPDDIPCDNNEDDDEITLRTLHCHDCDAVLYD